MKTISNKVILCAAAIFTAVVSSTLVAPRASAASLQEITNFGSNPTNLRMHLYAPDSLPNNAAVLVAVHYCTGSGPAYYSGTQFASLADRYGYIVIYPSATRSGNCFDVSSPQALTHNGNSDPAAIISMVNYVKQNFSVDSTRVFVAGSSSGAMMTNVLLGVYPDVFKAGAAFAGVPFGCFATTDGSTWNSNCATGNINKTPQEWGNLVRAAYPSYGGTRPRIQLWHGTADETLNYRNFNEAIEQWTNVFSLSQTPTYTDTPQSGYTRTRYGSSGGQAQVEAISMQGVTHNLPVNAAEAIRFFGLNSSVSSSSLSSSSVVSSSSTPRSSSSIPSSSSAPTSSSLSSSPSSISSSFSSSSIPRSSSSSSSIATGARCNWYGSPIVLCNNTTSGWGWENQQSCVSRSTCSGQPAPYGIIGGTTSSAPASSSSSRPASSSSSSSSSVPSGQNCNWYGQRYPLCVTTPSGWGWENQRSCIARTTCSAQPSPFGVVN